MDKTEYDLEYQRTRCKQYKLLLHRERDKDIISFLDSLPNRNGFLKDLIRKQIKKG